MSARNGNDGCAVVTGGTRGIGAAIAERLETDGWKVARLGRTSGDVQADVSDPEQVQAAFEDVRERFGPILVLVNNAGVRHDGLTIRMPADEWQAVVDTNLSGAFHCTRRALDDMLKARWGRIVNVSSVVAERANPGQANYVAAKAGLLGFTRTVAREMARKGVTSQRGHPRRHRDRHDRRPRRRPRGGRSGGSRGAARGGRCRGRLPRLRGSVLRERRHALRGWSAGRMNKNPRRP